MLRNTMIALMMLAVPTTASSISLTEEQITELLQNKIRVVQHMALNPLLVKAVRRRNADPEADAGGARALEDGDHAVIIRRFVESNPELNTALLADARGSGVAAWPLDKYGQSGDAEWEGPYQESYNRGDGQIFVSPLRLDEKGGGIATAIAAPVMDRGETIGVLIVGVNLGGTR